MILLFAAIGLIYLASMVLLLRGIRTAPLVDDTVEEPAHVAKPASR